MSIGHIIILHLGMATDQIVLVVTEVQSRLLPTNRRLSNKFEAMSREHEDEEPLDLHALIEVLC